MTQLQHLELVRYSIAGGSGTAQLLLHLQPLQQLTHLNLTHTPRSNEPNPPAEAYSAVTASSMLQHLNISCGSCGWQQVCDSICLRLVNSCHT